MRKALWFAGLLGATGFAAYAGVILMDHAQRCDPAYRQCPVEPGVLAFHLDRWCNAPSIGEEGPIRETFARDGARIAVTREVLRSGERVVATARFVNDAGRIQYRVYDDAGRPVTGMIRVFENGADGRVSELGPGRRTGWVRCERMASAGVPEAVRTLYR